ncbi:MAG: LVIVD repeat-containing protein [Gemmatimonadota bacterium]
MRRWTLSLVLLPLLPLPTGALLAQSPETPEGYTAYQLLGPGINAPPLPFRIEGDRMVAPEGSMVTVTESRLTDDRIEMTLDVPGGTARFLGARQGDAFAGYMFIVSDDERDMAPVTLTPAGREADLAPDPGILASAPGISRVEVVPSEATLDPGESRRFVVRAFDESGSELTDPEVEWFAGGGRTLMTEDGEFTGFEAGERQVVALVGGQAMALTTVTVKEPVIASLSVYTDVPSRLAVGSRVPLEIDALNTVHRWELEPKVEITSSAPEVVAVDGDALVAVAPGRATVAVEAGEALEEYAIEVVAASGSFSITGAPEGTVRTGDVVRLGVSVEDAQPVWAVAERGAEVYPDGAFVADRPGTYTVLAKLGESVATATVVAGSRNVSGRIHMNGHGLNLSTYSSDLWPQNEHVYIGTHQANQVRTYDVSDPSAPVLADTQLFDARVVNDVKVSADGKWLVATREGAVDRRNGILVFSLADPAHPELVSEYTETLTSGVHNVFWVGSLVYCVNDGTGDMHIIDLSDPANPEEVGRWGLPIEGRALHDVWVQEGVAYLSYLWDGLVILDVGGAGQGGTPEEPVLVSRIFYPRGPTHSAFRYGDYVFVGDEDFSLRGTMPQIEGLGVDPRGPVHVIDVSDLSSPRYVGKYEVPEAGVHNFWVDEEAGILYAGYYQGGIRAVDVTGELRGELYRQGREIAYFLPAAGPAEAKLPYQTMVWGVFPMFENGWRPIGEMLYATDYNSGLWSFTVEIAKEPIS